MRRFLTRLLKSKEAAVAPTVALSLVGLIASGGLAFDYARLAAMDTELQQAADQAALAAATQLDRAEGAQTRAAAAIQAVDSDNRLASNLTRFASFSDGEGPVVTIASIVFCETFDDGEPDNADACAEVASDDEDADVNSRFVMVTTSVRTANYTLTPIVGLFRSSEISATAIAGVDAQICNVAPLLVCVANDGFPSDADIGKGMVMKAAGGDAWAPGNYGLLDFGNGNNAVIDALVGNGLNGCQSTDDNETEPGNKNVTDAINTRMDVYDGGPKTKDPADCDPDTGASCPANNTRKDMTLEMTYEVRQSSSLPEPTPPNCGAVASATVSYSTSFARNVDAIGFGRDTCHYTNSCSGGNFGDANWDRAGYIAANHPGIAAATIASELGGGKTATTLTRYDIYRWELLNETTGAMDPRQVGITPPPNKKVTGPNTTWTFKKQCSFSKPKLSVPTGAGQKDRRILPVVAANCDNLKGKGAAFEDYVLLRVFDVFLPEPSLPRSAPMATEDKEIYGEVIGPAETASGGSGFQYYARSKPFLVR